MLKPNTQTSILIVILLAGAVHGEPIRQPLSLKAGDQYRLAFVTTATTKAESANIDFYNLFVQATADAAPIGDWGLEWKAIASTEAVSARENTETHPVNDQSAPIFLLNGTELVPSYSALWNTGTDYISRSFDINEFSERIILDQDSLLVWTGSGTNGLPRPLKGVGIQGGPLGSGTHSRTGLGDSSSAGVDECNHKIT